MPACRSAIRTAGFACGRWRVRIVRARARVCVCAARARVCVPVCVHECRLQSGMLLGREGALVVWGYLRPIRPPPPSWPDARGGLGHRCQVSPAALPFRGPA